VLYKLTRRHTHTHAPLPAVSLYISTLFPTEPAGKDFLPIDFEMQRTVPCTWLFWRRVPVRGTPLPPARDCWNRRLCLQLEFGSFWWGDTSRDAALWMGGIRGHLWKTPPSGTWKGVPPEIPVHQLYWEPSRSNLEVLSKHWWETSLVSWAEVDLLQVHHNWPGNFQVLVGPRGDRLVQRLVGTHGGKRAAVGLSCRCCEETAASKASLSQCHFSNGEALLNFLAGCWQSFFPGLCVCARACVCSVSVSVFWQSIPVGAQTSRKIAPHTDDFIVPAGNSQLKTPPANPRKPPPNPQM